MKYATVDSITTHNFGNLFPLIVSLKTTVWRKMIESIRNFHKINIGVTHTPSVGGLLLLPPIVLWWDRVGVAFYSRVV